jgi:hypothetical protein
MPYWAVLVGVLGFALALRNWRMAWTAALLLGNWGVNTWIAHVSGTQFNWAAMGLVDYLTAALILGARLTRWQIMVACLFAFQLVAHAAYAWSGSSPWSDYYYWHALSKLAWLQAFAVAGWGGHDIARIMWRRLGADRRVRIVAALRFGSRTHRGGSR